jgi:hypothetical protein
MPDAPLLNQPPSPTGTPVIPPSLVPILAGLVGVAGVLSQVLPQHTVAVKVCVIISLNLGPLLGMLSPGIRKR